MMNNLDKITYYYGGYYNGFSYFVFNYYTPFEISQFNINNKDPEKAEAIQG